MGLRHVLLFGLVLSAAPVALSVPGSAQPSINNPINNPGPSAPGDWTVYPGSYNSQRHSPLKQVTPANAHQLQVKWVYHVAGSHELEMTPVVMNGVMYVAQFNRVDAIDARTGNVIWRYQRPARLHRGLSRHLGL